MSSYSAKLERVRWSGFIADSAPPRAIESDGAPPRGASREHEAELPADPRQRLDALRDKIAGILAKAPPIRRLFADPAQGDLPFVREETPHGALYVRIKRLSPAHRVGRAPLNAAIDASSAMLALLALDPTLAALDPRRALYLDTETTGLSGGTGTVPFLVGLAWFEPGSSSLVVEQLLLRQLGEETPIMERLARRVEQASMLVTYNGKSFDMPLLDSRRVMCRLDALPRLAHLDLVHVARRVHRHRLTERNLASIEAHVLGMVRTADISGGEVCSRYRHFLRTGEEAALAAVVDHNEWDLVAMAALVGLYGEPLTGLGPIDWVGVAKTAQRARAFDLASDVAERAVAAGAGPEALRARAEIAKARGDKARALADFATLVASVDDPALRLELAKLYEHHAKAPLSALELLDRGTGEGEEASQRRRARLERKRDRASKIRVVKGKGR